MSVQYQTATIANGATTSGAVDLGGNTLCGIRIPSAFTGTTLTFQFGDADGSTFVTMITGAGADYSKTVAPGKYLPLTPADFAGFRWIRIVSGSTEAGARTLNLLTRRFS